MNPNPSRIAFSPKQRRQDTPWRPLLICAIAMFCAVPVGWASAKAAHLHVYKELWKADTPRLDQAETRYLSFGDKTALTCLGEGWHSRFRVELHGGMVWSSSVLATLQVTVFTPRALTLTLSMAPYVATKLPPQRVVIQWNSTRVGVCAFDPANGAAPRSAVFNVPAAAQTPGVNTITFWSRYAVSPKQLGIGQEEYTQSFGLKSLALSTGPATTQSDSHRIVAVTDGNTLKQIRQSRLKFPFDVPPTGHTELRLAAPFPTQGRIFLRWDTLGGVHQRELFNATRKKATGHARTFDLSKFHGRRLELIFDTVGARSGPIVWTKPTLLTDFKTVAPAKPHPPKTASAKQPVAANVVIVLLDALRADELGCYGYMRDTSPFIDSLAKTGVRFEHAYSGAPYTISSTWSLFTGLYPFQHGGYDPPLRPAKNTPVLQRTLSDAGILTGCVSSNPYVEPETGVTDGFSVFHAALEKFKRTGVPVGANETGVVAAHTLDKELNSFAKGFQRNPAITTDAALDFLRKHKDQRFFLYTHYMMPHQPYIPPKAYAYRFTFDFAKSLIGETGPLWQVNYHERGITREECEQLRARYDENLAAVDAQVRRLYQELQTLGIAKKTVFIVIADHGEEFMEHGLLLHTQHVYQQMTHVPLIMHGPHVKELFEPVSHDVVSTISLYATICGLMGVPAPHSIMGKSLLKAGSESPDEVHAYAEAVATMNPLEAYWWPRYKLIRDGFSFRVQVYDLQNDPGEHDNLAKQYPVLTDELLARAQVWKRHAMKKAVPHAPIPVGYPMRNDQKRLLEALGYLSPAAAKAPEAPETPAEAEREEQLHALGYFGQRNEGTK